MSKGFASDKQRRYVMMKLNKDTSYREYNYGDFDEDGTPNMDDRYPFDPYRKSRINEILISEELDKIEEYNEKYREDAEKIAEKEGGTYRIKHPHSTVNKLRKKYLKNLKDIGAIRVIVADKPALDRRVQKIRQDYKDDIVEDEDFYKTPKGGYYFAHHFIIRCNDGRLIELQVQTKRMSKFYLKTHEGYKREFDEKYKDKLLKEANKIKELDENK